MALPTIERPSLELTESDLLALPFEVRSLILEKLLLCQDGPLSNISSVIATWANGIFFCRHPGTSYHWGYLERTSYEFYPAILSTCRQLYDEGISILYAENTFWMHSMLKNSLEEVSTNDQELMVSFHRINSINNLVYSHEFMARIKKVHLDFYVDSVWRTDSHNALKQQGHAFRQLTGLQHLSIKILAPGKRFSWYELNENRILHALGQLRCKQVSMSGAQLTCANRLKQVIEGDTPPRDLRWIYLDLMDFLGLSHVTKYVLESYKNESADFLNAMYNFEDQKCYEWRDAFVVRVLEKAPFLLEQGARMLAGISTHYDEHEYGARIPDTRRTRALASDD